MIGLVNVALWMGRRYWAMSDQPLPAAVAAARDEVACEPLKERDRPAVQAATDSPAQPRPQPTRRRDESRQRASGARRLVDVVPFFKAFCNSTRAQIIDFLLGGERCVCEMTGPLDQSQPLVSHHLALLRDAGIVRMRSEGARTYYSIDWERFDGDLKGFLDYVEQRRSAPRAAEATAQRLRGRRQAGEEAQRFMTTGREWAMADDATGVRETDEQGLASKRLLRFVAGIRRLMLWQHGGAHSVGPARLVLRRVGRSDQARAQTELLLRRSGGAPG